MDWHVCIRAKLVTPQLMHRFEVRSLQIWEAKVGTHPWLDTCREDSLRRGRPFGGATVAKFSGRAWICEESLVDLMSMT